MLAPAFAAHVRRLPGLLKKLLGAKPVPLAELPKDIPAAGVYLISNGKRHLYVGQASREGASMRMRIAEHSRPGRSSFAWRCGADLIKKPVASIFHVTPPIYEAIRKCLLRKLTVRYIEETEPIRRCLLELYAYTVLRTPYNVFGVHRKEDMALLRRSLHRMQREEDKKRG